MFTLRLVAILALMLLAIFLCGCSQRFPRPDDTPIAVGDGSLSLKSPKMKFKCFAAPTPSRLEHPDNSGNITRVTITEDLTTKPDVVCPSTGCSVKIEYRGHNPSLTISGSQPSGTGLLIETTHPPRFADWTDTNDYGKEFDHNTGPGTPISKVTVNGTEYCDKVQSCLVVVRYSAKPQNNCP